MEHVSIVHLQLIIQGPQEVVHLCDEMIDLGANHFVVVGLRYSQDICHRDDRAVHPCLDCTRIIDVDEFGRCHHRCHFLIDGKW